jgi:mono/diheme cytochrome c family protein
MGKFGKTVSALTVTLAASGLMGCEPGSWLGEREPSEEVDKPSDDFPGSIPPIDAGVSKDGGFVSVPVRLSSLIVADRPPPAISGGSLTVTKAGDLALAADPDRDSIYLVQLPEGKVQTIQLAQDSEPGRVLLDGAGGAHVGLRNKGTVVRIDLATGTISHETTTCQLPRGLAYDERTDEVLVACASGELVTLAAKTHEEHARSFVDLDLRDVVIGKDGQRFVTRYRSAELLAVGADGKVQKSSRPLVTRSQRFETEEPTSNGNGSFNGGGSFRQVSASAALAWKTVGASNGTTVMVHQQSQDDEVIISSAGGYGGGCQPITQGGITRYDADGKPSSAPILLGGSALVVDVAASDDGKWFALAKPGAYLRGEQGSVEVLAANLVVTTQVDSDAGVMPNPDPLPGVFLDGGVLPPFASECNTGAARGESAQTTAVAFDGQGTLYALSREPAQLTVYQVFEAGFNSGFAEMHEIQTVTLSTISKRDSGHELFHGDVGTGLACASCHGEALDDGHVWNFRDFGPRRTQNMRGGLLSTLPLHWEGDLPSFQNLVDEVMTRRMGGFKVEPKFADALANWIDKQPSITIKATDTAAAERGKALFESSEVACSSCHAGSTLTNNQTVDVGTGGLFQVPSLRGLSMHAPFMHDGCAATLADRFDAPCGGGDKHGKTSQLTPAQLGDLVVYLQTL